MLLAFQDFTVPHDGKNTREDSQVITLQFLSKYVEAYCAAASWITYDQRFGMLSGLSAAEMAANLMAMLPPIGYVSPFIELTPSDVRVNVGGTGNSYNPANPGPLSNDIANTFSGGSYTQTVLTEDTTFYRVYGSDSGQVGRYMSRTPQNGTMQSQMDLALDPQWGNTATSVTTETVPKGTIIYEGIAAPQGNFLGGGNQVYIPKEVLNPSWFRH